MYVQYIGETGRKLKDRMGEHLNYARKPDLSQPTGAHFNMTQYFGHENVHY